MFTIKQYNTLPLLEATLLDSNSQPVDLTDAVVSFAMRSRDNDTRVIDGEAFIVDELEGKVAYPWAALDTIVPGAYYGEFSVEYPGGGIESFPNSNYIEIHVVKSAGNAP
jgi:hypothetical protein